jgi:hypothetical protein
MASPFTSTNEHDDSFGVCTSNAALPMSRNGFKIFAFISPTTKECRSAGHAA